MPEDADSEDVARISYPRGPGGRRVLLIQYRDVRLTINWPRETKGNADLDRLIASLPDLLKEARTSLTVSDAVQDFDAEVEKFWNDEESK